ncbi:MAG: DUF2304 domain-containing protein [Bacteroidota bacterium]
MKPIQFILVPIFLFLMLSLGRRLRQQPILRLMVWALLAAGIVFTIFEDSSTMIANLLGIGRGVDMIIYLSLLGLGVSSILLYLRTRSLEQKIAELIRLQSLQEARKP